MVNLSYCLFKKPFRWQAVILETLRMQTPLGILLRTCTRDYTLPGTQIRLRWGLKKVFSYNNKNELIL
jgi:hypothetical protein